LGQPLNSQPSLLPSSASTFETIELPDGRLRFADAFYSADEAQAMLRALLAETPWQQEFISVYGKRHAQPRLSAWYGDADAHYSYSGIQLTPLAWTTLLHDIKSAIESASGHYFNSVLLNYYRDGQDSMGWHSDDELSLGVNPVIASLSLGATRRFKLRHISNRLEKIRVLALAAGSVLMMEDATQHYWQHSVPKESVMTGARVNLTFRQILNLETAVDR
jgi:alkylated DNA repair dioxygenase AlkB